MAPPSDEVTPHLVVGPTLTLDHSGQSACETLHSQRGGKAFIFSHGGRAVLSQLLYFAQVCFPFFLLGTCLTDKLELCSASLACIEKQG